MKIMVYDRDISLHLLRFAGVGPPSRPEPSVAPPALADLPLFAQAAHTVSVATRDTRADADWWQRAAQAVQLSLF